MEGGLDPSSLGADEEEGMSEGTPLGTEDCSFDGISLGSSEREGLFDGCLLGANDDVCLLEGASLGRDEG